MAPLPLLKLSALVLKTLAKPLASYMKAAAPKYQRLNKCYNYVGQQVHWVTTRLNIMAAGHKVLTINPLPEAEGVSRGIDFLSEVFVFAFGGTIIMVEFLRNEAKNQAKLELAAREEAAHKAEVTAQFQSFTDQITGLQARIDTVEELLYKENPTKFNALKKKPKAEKPAEEPTEEEPPAPEPSIFDSIMKFLKL